MRRLLVQEPRSNGPGSSKSILTSPNLRSFSLVRTVTAEQKVSGLSFSGSTVARVPASWSSQSASSIEFQFSCFHETQPTNFRLLSVRRIQPSSSLVRNRLSPSNLLCHCTFSSLNRSSVQLSCCSRSPLSAVWIWWNSS
uniref:(northern house mosquito) hypothetical protein n=1 Tax=Culex pipiens TaxID=7175 RepID=A0A8D8BL46_CULPI